jgi:alkanesulfonate monooxygenase SsuD/methylene tetrahydromethanopterin reductase-like flavin-dependent oxidoreductase (luciferase family)
MKRKTGRPTKYSAARAKSICDAIASGQTAREIAATQAIHWQTVCNWREQYPEFAAQLKAAQAARAELMAAEILEISDDSSADWIEYETATGRIRREPNHELVQRSRLRVETRKYLMEKWSPERYGAMQRLELTGVNGGPILLEQITMVAMAELEAERAAAANHQPPAIDDPQDAPRLTHNKP